MPNYRLHFVSADRKPGRGYKVECPSDSSVLDVARSLHHAHAIDVWEGRRKVARVHGELARDRRN